MNIGIILPSLDANQLAFETILSINTILSNGTKNDYRIFFENLSPKIIQPLCSIMNITELWHYNGLLITTTLENTKLAIKAIADTKIVFIVWDLEWLRGHNNYIDNISIYRNPNIILLARSKDHAKIIENYCGRRPNGIIESLNFEELANVIQ